MNEKEAMHSLLNALVNHAARSNPQPWIDARMAEMKVLFGDSGKEGKEQKENESAS